MPREDLAALVAEPFSDSAALEPSAVEADEEKASEQDQAEMFDALSTARGAEGVAIMSELLHSMGFRRPGDAE